uniref:receptor protein-tyrosine kinase n=1 Tax=Caenorhabditis japonica TaxID=281687 RepID=A0A8R1E4M9_CAEJA
MRENEHKPKRQKKSISVCLSGPCELDKTETKCRYLEQAEGRLQSCWNDTVCMQFCPYDRLEDNKMGPGCDAHGNRCHDECLGGCERPDDATSCHSCRHLHYKGKCVEKCEDHLYVLLDRRCVTKKTCLSLNPVLAGNPATIKATNGLCSDRCPDDYEINPENPKECRKCVGECTIVCPGNYTIDTFPKAMAIRRCNVIDGSLTIEMRAAMDTGMANELSELFSRIHTIRGYLQVIKSPPFLTLHMFRSLKRIEGRELFAGKYALSVIENPNLRKLFDPAHKFAVEIGDVQLHNNRMLCFAQIRQLMTDLGRIGDMNEADQSPSSNGDKAICEDARIEVNVTSVSHDFIVLRWTAFNTTDMDHRKFLGYEIFYKEVERADPEMSIDDDRSACLDSWSSVFKQHKQDDDEMFKSEKENENDKKITQMLYTDQRIKPFTTYAYYVATQMVHHPGAKNGISKIGFVTTKYFNPDPPVVTVTKVSSDSIELSWEPPLRPNGVITHYMVVWREIDVDAEAEAEGFCADDNTRAISTYSNQVQPIDRDDDPPLVTTVAPSLTSMLKGVEGTCSAIVGCCACGIKTNDLERTDENAEFENHLLNEIITQKDTMRRKRAIENANRVSDMLEKQKTTTASPPIDEKIKSPRKLNYVHTKKPKSTTVAATVKTTEIPTTTTTTTTATQHLPPVYHEEKMVVAGKWTKNITAKAFGNTYNIINLKHYTSYSISVMACQSMTATPTFCSVGFKAAKKKRTKALLNIDRVANETIKVEFLNDTSTLHITWDKVKESNGGITGYMVQMVGLDGRSPPQECVAAKKGWTSEKNGTIFRGLADGQYRVSITAYSLYRNGEPSIRYELITVSTPGFWTWERILIGLALVVILISIAVVVAYYYVRKHYGKKVKAMADFMQNNPEYCMDQVYIVDDWELDQGCVSLDNQIGEGSFGKVYMGCGNAILSKCGTTFGPCAIKINNDDLTSTESMNYLMEASIMKNFDTPFIVKLYGVISSVSPAWVVMEMMDRGNLRDYLRSRREDEVFNEMDCEYYGVIPRETFHEWAAQISDGMAYLESLKFVHRDLAARNCMIDTHEKVKIGDFGMARDLFYHEYYKPSGKRMMPVRWMSPESLKDGKFDSKSDMWSFGIVLYEMMTLGAQPYIGLSNDEVLNYIGMARKIIKKPECCSDYWYKIMTMCWRYNPRDRPSFLQLVHLFAASASRTFREASFVLNDNHMTLNEGEELDMEGTVDCEVLPNPDRRYTDSIPMRELRAGLNQTNSESTVSVHDASDSSPSHPLMNGKQRQRSMDDEYALMNLSHGANEVDARKFNSVAGCGDGDYVERDVQMDAPTRRNTGASSSSYGNAYCLANRGGSNVSSGFMETVRLTDGVGSGHLDEGDYVEKDLSMDTRRSTGASTASYGQVPTNWTANKGSTFYANREAPKTGGGDRLTQLPGTGHLHNRDGDYILTEPKNGSPSRNGNDAYCNSVRGSSFSGRKKFGENDRLMEDNEHPLA